ncbi:MAG: phosphodiesterase [Marinifilaceae bacterium]
MKIFFVSDIHGSLTQLEIFERILKEEKPDQLVILGDVMYHGPRNPLPDGYDPAGVANLLNVYKDRIIAVRGNCDSEVDQMLLDFPIMADSAHLIVEDKRFFLTHGHLFSSEKPPHIQPGAILVSGHTHVPAAHKEKGIFLFNPGSLALPKNDFPPSFGIYRERMLQVVDLEGNIIKELLL